jgi:Fuc2NAc and GlcNAc transferase
MLGGVFLFDATATVLRRMLRGERWYAAHRSHAYQRAISMGWGHARVTIVAMLLALLCGGLAVLATSRSASFPGAVVLMLLVLGSVYLWIERRKPMFPSRESPRPNGAGR